MEQFGKRFEVSENSVYRWEHGLSEAPYKVVEFCEYVIEEMQVCPACNGTGILNKKKKQDYLICMGIEGIRMIFPHFTGGRTIAGTARTHQYLSEKGNQFLANNHILEHNVAQKPEPVAEPANEQARTVGYKVRQIRISLGETQAVFGQRFHVSSAAVSLWETNKANPPKEALELHPVQAA